MKKIIGIASLLILAVACKKDSLVSHLAENKGCIKRITASANQHHPDMGSADIIVINSLFNNNKIDASKYRYEHYRHDSVQTYFPPYATFDDKTIKVSEFANGLRIFTGQLVYQFINNLFSFKGGYATPQFKLDTTASLTLGQVRKLFIDNTEQFDRMGHQFEDSCIGAEFGYFNLNASTGDTTQHIVKAWKVNIGNNSWPVSYPMAYYQDDNGKLIYYDNGIRTFK